MDGPEGSIVKEVENEMFLDGEILHNKRETMTVSITVEGITLDKFMQMFRIMKSNKTVKGWNIVNLGTLDMAAQVNTEGMVTSEKRTGTCTVEARKVR